LERAAVSVVLVDWLGRGGIAQTSESWAIELRATGIDTVVVTRPHRELGSGVIEITPAPARRGRLRAHRAVADEAARRIREQCPDVVVVQNYVAPVLERPVFEAARDVCARVVIVVHDHRLHTVYAGTRAGLKQELRRADVVVAHTSYVADGVRAYSARDDVRVVPHPVQIGMLRQERARLDALDGGRLLAGTFGVLKRAYKGSSVFEALAEQGVEPWAFLAAGTGAPEEVPGMTSLPGYAPPGQLTAAVAATDVTVAPYTHATQSGVVVLAHVLGSVPIASAVGGIPEQIEDGVDGLLVAAGASVDVWRDALATLTDDEHRKAIAAAGEARAWRDHEAFVKAILEIAA
jgi:glycosyltransferase involved in cell wall biosynthesis